MGNKALNAVFFIALILLVCGEVSGQGDFRLLVGGQQIFLQNFLARDGSLFVTADEKELGRIAGLLGAQINYDRSQNQIAITTTGHIAYLFPSGLSVDGKNVSLAVSSFIQDGKWYVPLESLAKAFGASLVFDSNQDTWYMDPFVTGVWLQAKSGGIAFVVQSTGPVEPTVTTLDNPNRIAVDFPYAVLSPDAQIPDVQSNALTGTLRLAQMQTRPNVVRLAIDLTNSDVHWTTSTDGDGRQFSLTVSPNIPLQNFSLQQTKKEGEPAAGSGIPATLVNVSFSKVEEESREDFVAELKISGSAKFEWHQLKSPDNRLFIDLKNCLQGITQYPQYQSSTVDDIRLSQFQQKPFPVARIVFALHDTYQVEVKPTSEGLRVVVSPAVQELSQTVSGEGTTGSVPVSAPPNGIIIVLDPGHGGRDTGAIGRHLMEKDVTLDLALRLRRLLTDEGFNVLMTRTADQECLGYEGTAKAELQCRADVANRSKAALFVSLHINASDYSWPRGVSTHWYKSVDTSLASAIQNRLSAIAAFADRGITRNRFYVLRSTAMPAVLVEMGFITNAQDEGNLEDFNLRQKLMESLRDGIMQYAGVRPGARL